MRRFKKTYIRFVKAPDVERTILDQAKHENEIIYGAQSIKKQTGIFSRKTSDYDIFSLSPKKSAKKIEKKLDNVYGWNNFYVKPAMHPGTYKVMDVGMDGKPKTDDDVGVADYTVMPKPKPKFVNINGVKYRDLRYEEKAKIRSIKDKSYAYRHEKDKEDLARIKLFEGKK